MDSHKAEKRVPLEGGAAILTVVNGVIALAWETSSGRRQKSLPASLRTSDPGGIERVNKLVQSIRADLTTWKRRIEGYYLENVSWSYDQWRARYADHGTLSLLSRRLIWQAEADGETISFRPTRDGCIGGTGKPVTVPASSTIALWHPIHARAEEVSDWQKQLLDREIIQPFRQAWREIYRVTDAERSTGTYSNRFAGHIIKQSTMRALAIDEGWKCPHRTGFDSPDDDPAHIVIPAFDLQAEYWTSAFHEFHEFTPGGSFIFIKSDRVAFHTLDSKAKHGRGSQVTVETIPPLVFSEIMRHCDLFTSVAAVSIDPEWVDRGKDALHPTNYDKAHIEYWVRSQESPPLPSAKMRERMLAALLSNMTISDRVKIENNFVHVQGRLNNYCIHIGSSAVSIAENRRHVCIIPARSFAKMRISLPFDADTTLTVILSKIMLLLNDDKIDDKIIVRQIT